jgi:perosamine synthetase
MDVSQIEGRITERTKALIVQHTFGIPAEMDRITMIARRHGLYVIEDSCHTLASSYRGRTVGQFGDASFYSFEWGKPLVIGLGGVAVVHNDCVRRKLEAIYSEFVQPKTTEVARIHLQYLLHGTVLTPSLFWRVRDLYRFLSGLGVMVGTFEKEELAGQPSDDCRKGMSTFHQRLLRRKLESLDATVAHRRWVGSQYERILADLGLATLELGEESDPVFLRYPLETGHKSAVIAEARKMRVELGDWFVSPVHPLEKAQWGSVRYQEDSCRVAEQTCKRVITLPIHGNVGEREIQRARDFLRSVKARGYL